MPYIVHLNRACDDAECNPNCRNRKHITTEVDSYIRAHEVVYWAARNLRTPSTPYTSDSQISDVINEDGGTIELPGGHILEVVRTCRTS